MSSRSREAERGFMLLGLIVAIFLILLVLGVAAPRVARALRRDREVEALHRGNQYVRAIQLFYRKTGHYPGSLDQLEKTNSIRYLRHRYVDPMTGKPNWRLIHVGEAKTTVKGFFGKPLAGLPGAGGLGSAAGMVSSGQPGSSTPGAAGTGAGNAPSGSTTNASASSGPSGTPSPAVGTGATSGFGSSTSSGSSGIGSQSATSFTGGGAPIVGISSVAQGSSILVLNEQTTYATWEFLYDPRIEQLKAKGALLGGPATSSGTGSGIGSGVGAPTPGFGTPAAPSTGTGTGGAGTSPTPGGTVGSPVQP